MRNSRKKIVMKNMRKNAMPMRNPTKHTTIIRHQKKKLKELWDYIAGF